MPADTDTGDFDEQDVAETFDETLTDGDERASSDGMDVRRDRFDVVSAVGDNDLEGDDDALDADEEDEDALGEIGEVGEVAEQQEADDLDNEGRDKDPLASDDIRDFASDRDFADDDDIDGVSSRSSEDVETVAMGDLDSLGGAQGERMADLESDSLSDSDLEELDYKEA